MQKTIDLSKVTLVVSEIDGVLTDNIAPITETGNVLYKYYCMKDFEAINRIKRNFDFAFLGADNSVNYSLCSIKKIPFFWAKDDKENRKGKLISNVMQRYSANAESTLYVGSNYSDEECMHIIPLSFAPSDAVELVKNKAFVTMNSMSATGVLCELYDTWLFPEVNRRIRSV